MNSLREGLTVTCPMSEGVYLLLEDLGNRGWRCLVIVADENYSDMESCGSVVVISLDWLNNVAEVVKQ